LFEDFEGIGTGSSINPNEPACWRFVRTQNGGFGYGYTYSNATYAYSGLASFYLYSSSNMTTDTMAFVSPIIDSMDANPKLIKFWARKRYAGTSYTEQIIVGTVSSPDDLNTFVALDTFDLDLTYKQFQMNMVASNGYNGTHMHIALVPIGNYYTQLDDISIENIPLCDAPWSINGGTFTSSSANITWSTVYGTNFQIEYGPQGFIQGTGNGTYVNNATSGTTITGLSPNTYYDVYVADSCDTTNAAGPYTFKTDCLSQLTGNYTIGGVGADFAKLDSAIYVLAGCGVSGPTTLTLQNNDTSFIHLGVIAGGSSTNTVVLKGSSSAATDTVFITGGMIRGIELDGSSYITFKDLTFIGNTVNRLVWLHNNAHHVTFDNCKFIMPTSTSSLFAVIAATNDPTSIFSYGDNANDITIKNCDLNGGYVGAVFNGTSSASYSSNLTIENCTFRDQGYYGIRAYYMEGVEIVDNDILLTGGYAMYIYYVSDFNIVANKAYAGVYGMYLYRSNYLNTGITSRSTITNNFIGASGNYGMYGGYWEDVDIVHNSIRGGGIYGLYVYGLIKNMGLRNNIIVGGSNYAIYNSATAINTSGVTVDNNVYHTETGANIAYWAGSAYAALSNWQTADTTMNVNSLQGNPGFTSNFDFHVVGTLSNDVGDNTVNILEDIDGDTRPASGSTIVDIGADEFTPLNWDASLLSIDVPLAGCGDSATTIMVEVKNFGLNDINSLPITVQVSGGITQTINYTTTDTLTQGQTKTYIIGSINTYSGVAGVMFDGYTSLTGDQKVDNDTISNVGPGNYLPVEPIGYPGDTVCSTIDSTTLAAVTIPGVTWSWYANALDTVAVDEGDSLTVATSGQNTWYLGYAQGAAGSLTTAFAGGNSCGGGTMFNITATNTIAINGFDVSTTLASGANTPVSIYYIANGTYVGNEITAANWTLHETTSSTSAGMGNATFVPLTSEIVIPGGSTYAIYVNYASSYTNGNGTNQVVTNSDMTINLGVGLCGLFSGVNNPRIFNGTVHYGSAGCSDIKFPITFGIITDTAVAAFTHVVDPNGADVDFDGSSSLGHTWTWDFGDGGVGSGQMATHTYANGTYTACLVVTDTICGSSDSICTTVNANVGIDEGLIGETLTLYPNPNDGIFRIDFEIEGLKDIEIRITDVTGRLIFTKDVGKASGAYREDIDISNNAKGMYILQIKSDDVIVSRRVTIQ